MTEKEYEVYCDDEWVAGSTDLDEAVSYAHQYREEGSVVVYEVEKKYTLVLKASKRKTSNGF